MHIDILTLFPEMFAPLGTSMLGKAIEKGLLTIHSVNIRDESNILLYTDKLTVRLGSGENTDYKLSVMAAFIDQYPDKEGVLHLEYPDEQIYLEPFEANA